MFLAEVKKFLELSLRLGDVVLAVEFLINCLSALKEVFDMQLSDVARNVWGKLVFRDPKQLPELVSKNKYVEEDEEGELEENEVRNRRFAVLVGLMVETALMPLVVDSAV